MYSTSTTQLKHLLLGFILLNFFSISTAFALIKPDSIEIDKPTKPSNLDSIEIENTNKALFARFDSIANDELKNFVPSLFPEIIKDRLICMNTTIKMTYHQDVLSWIKLYTVKQRAQTQRILERSSFYFPIFEEALKRHEMPDELKYLSIVESALIPNAQSWAAAVGLWQFIPSTGKEYGLEQDWFIDERMDIYKSTDAACRYLKFLYKYHGDWQLALAAYNCGPGRVNWAVKQAGGKTADFWQIYNFLPRETRSYVPAFISVCYAMNYSEEHFIRPDNPHVFIPSDTIHINQFLNIEEFAKQIDVPLEHMELLNPHLKKKAIPAYKKNYPLRFPASKSEMVTANRSEILRASSRASRREVPYTAGDADASSTTEGKKQVTHTVSSGQSLSYIALQYGVTVSNIRIWNRLSSNMIHPNQKLAVWVKETPKAASTTATTPPAKTATKTTTTTVTPSANAKYHTVKSGDTLWDIAQKYQGLTVEKIRKLNNMNSRSMLSPGQKLVISN